MDKQKKEELAEMDSRWNFEKTVKTRYENDWDAVLNVFNKLQENQGDLYMEVDKLTMPSRIEKLKMRYREYRNNDFSNKVTFHHRQVYEWFLKLASYLNLTVGEAYYRTVYEEDNLRDELSLGDTMNVEISTIGEMEPEESKVGEDELKEMIEDDEG